jgi:hypothetical protein
MSLVMASALEGRLTNIVSQGKDEFIRAVKDRRIFSPYCRQIGVPSPFFPNLLRAIDLYTLFSSPD